MVNCNIPEYAQNIDFSKNYKPFTMSERDKCKKLIKEYRTQKLKNRIDKAQFIKQCIDAMLSENGIIDYAQLTIQWKQYQQQICKLEESDIVVEYYELLHDLATNGEYSDLIMVQAGSGKLKPAHRKVDENIRVTIKYKSDMFDATLD